MTAAWLNLDADGDCQKPWWRGSSRMALGNVLTALGALCLGAAPLLTLPWHYIGLVVALAGLLLRGVPLWRCPLWLPMLLFSLWLFAAALLAPYKEYGLIDSFIYSWLFIFVGWGLAQDKWVVRYFLVGVMLGILLSVGLGLLQFCYGYDQSSASRLKLDGDGVQWRRASGFMGNPIRYGLIAGLMGIVLWQVGGKVLPRCLAWPCSALAFIGTITSGSRGPLLAVALAASAAGLLASVCQRWRVIVVLASCALFLGLGALHLYLTAELRVQRMFAGDDPRWEIWRHSWELIRTHAWFGVGPDGFRPAYADLLQASGTGHSLRAHAHNSFLNIAVTAGVPGLILLGNVIFWAMLYYWRYRTQVPVASALGAATLLLFMVGGMTEDMISVSMMQNPTLLMIGFSLGLSVAAWLPRPVTKDAAQAGDAWAADGDGADSGERGA